MWGQTKGIEICVDSLMSHSLYVSTPEDLDMDDAIKDRINSLLLDNADLEQEVARLRYSRAAVAVEEDTETSRNDLERSRTSLLEAKRSLNDVSNENAQLRLEIGKAK